MQLALKVSDFSTCRVSALLSIKNIHVQTSVVCWYFESDQNSTVVRFYEYLEKFIFSLSLATIKLSS